MRVLVVNPGSSSLKLSVVSPDGTVEAATTLERWAGQEHVEPVRPFVDGLDGVEAVGHRVVHGGPRYRAPVVVDDELVGYLDSISDLAPLHNPRSVAGIRLMAELLPGTPAIACFDTAFHATMPPEAHTYGLPREWNARWGLRRYGFHGLSHAYASRRGAELAAGAAGAEPSGAEPPDGAGADTDGAGPAGVGLRLVSCHLGAGASLAAVRDGRCVDTTMGFTPLAGLVMATRSGDVDPGLLMWLLRHGGVSVDELNEALENRSGLKGLSGTSGDLREVLAGRAEGDPDCDLAFGVFVHQLCHQIAAMTAALGGLDVLVLTGGVGEHAPLVRAEAAARLGFLGVRLDRQANERAGADADISSAGAAVRTVVVTAREDLEIAREAARLLSAQEVEPAQRGRLGGAPGGQGKPQRSR